MPKQIKFHKKLSVPNYDSERLKSLYISAGAKEVNDRLNTLADKQKPIRCHHRVKGLSKKLSHELFQALYSDNTSKCKAGLDKAKFEPLDLAEYMATKFIFGVRDDRLHVFDERERIFHPLSESTGPGSFDDLVRKVIPAKFICSIGRAFNTEALLWLKGRMDIPKLPPFDDPNIIVYADGTAINLLSKGKFTAGPELGMTVRIMANRVKYDEKKFQDSVFYAYLLRFSNRRSEVMTAIRYMLALALTNRRTDKVGFYFVGPTSNGKSTLEHVLFSFYDQEFIATSSLAQLGERFGPAELFGKTLLICADEEANLWTPRTISFFKLITGRDSITAERKYEHPFKFFPHCLPVYMSNSLPQFTASADAGGAISSRLFVIPTGPTIPLVEQDTNLSYKLFAERDIIASWAIDYAKQLARGEVSRPAHVLEVQGLGMETPTKEELFRSWLEDSVKFKTDSKVSVDELLASYKAFSAGQDQFSVLSEKAFQMRLSNQFPGRKCRIKDRHFYIGIYIQGAHEIETEENTEGSDKHGN
jgi:P4 family phage/plasmid primase-like protien